MKRAATLVTVIAALAASGVAQDDRIVWTDGTVSEGVRVRSFTWREVTFTKRGEEETRSADAVASMKVEKVADRLKRAYGADSEERAYSEFMAQAESLAEKEPFVAQWAYLEAARLHERRGAYADAFAVLEEMVKKLPDTGFYPELYRMKLGYYLPLGQEKASSAQKVAEAFRKSANEQGWPDGFLHEANFYELLSRSVAGELTGSAYQSELESLLSKTEGAFPNVADLVRLQLANIQLGADDLEAAKFAFEQILEKEGISVGTRCQALLGLGQTYFKVADRSDTEPYRDALLTFLKVYLESEGAAPEHRAEALYHAALSAEKWRGPDSGAMARRLRGLLRRDFPDSPWANR